MAIVMKKAARKNVKLRLAVSGASGSGKTMGALLIMFGLIKAAHPELSDEEVWGRICVIDTENESASLYVHTTVGRTEIGVYNTINLEPPFSPQVYIDAIHCAEDNGIEGIIIDSLSHAWIGTGGALDQQGKIAERSGNSWTAWRTVTPQHNQLVDAMLQSKCHVIACMRAKQEYEQVIDKNGKKKVQAVGMGVQMRDGIEYEFTTAFMLDAQHIASTTKDRTKMFDGQFFTITPETGRQFYRWLSEATESDVAPEAPKTEMKKAPETEAEKAAVDEARVKKAHKMITDMIKNLIASPKEGQTTEERKAELIDKVTEICGTNDYLKINDINVLTKLYNELKDFN